MIYYKKKSWVKRLINKIFKKREIKADSLFLFFKKSIFCFVTLILALFVMYLFVLPKVIDENKIETILNSYLAKNSKLILDIEDLKISPNYKFEINLKADKIKFKYAKDKDFIVLDKPVIDVNLLTLFFGYIDLNQVKLDGITLNTNFRGNRYLCFDYVSLDIFDLAKNNSKFHIGKVKILSDKLVLNIYDENVKKNFYIKTNKIKFEKKPQTIINSLNSFEIKTKGNISSSKSRILVFDLDLDIKIEENALQKAKNLLKKLNYNPFLYADIYKFSAKSDVDLSVSILKSKNILNGKIDLSNLSFCIDNLMTPKNNLVVLFKNNKVISNFDFNFFKNQYIKVKSIMNISNNKYIDIDINSNDLDLEQLNQVIVCLSKIFNLKIDFSDLNLKGNLIANLHLKSNFKTISSNGVLLLKNAILSSKKLGFSLNNINADINLESNKIKISKANAYFDKAKFNLTGTIDDKLNLNLKIDSDLINISQIINILKTFPILSFTDLSDINFKNGFLKINSNIKGNLNKPIIESNSYLKNLKLFVISKKIAISISEIKIVPEIVDSILKSANFQIKNLKGKYKNYAFNSNEINLKIKKDNIQISQFALIFDGIKLTIEGILNNYNSKNQVLNLRIKAGLNDKNDFLIIKNQKLDFVGEIQVEKNNLIFKNSQILNSSRKIANIEGVVNNFYFDDIGFSKFKILTNEKISLILPKLDNLSFDVMSDIELNGKLNSLKINGNLNLFNISYSKIGLFVKDAILNLRDSSCYLNIYQGKIFDFNFDFISNAKYSDNKIIVNYANFVSNYIDIIKVESFLKNQKNMFSDFIEIKTIEGKIDTLCVLDLILNSVSFEGGFKNNILNIKSFNAQTLKGKVEGSANLNILSQKVNMDVILKEINARALSSKLKDMSIAASGKISALIRANFVGFEENEFLRSFDGYIKFNIDDGELAQFAKLERFLQAGNILSQSILKLSLNSTISAISKQNTGDFKTIEGTLKIKDGWANIQYIKTQGTNMSLYLTGRFNLLSEIADVKVLGRIPISMVSVLGKIGSFTTENIINKMSDDAKGIVKTLTVSPIEKMLSVEINQEDIDNIPVLVNQIPEMKTREFIVKIQGNIKNSNSINYFKWRKTQ